jgi:hypothetical protein
MKAAAPFLEYILMFNKSLEASYSKTNTDDWGVCCHVIEQIQTDSQVQRCGSPEAIFTNA